MTKKLGSLKVQVNRPLREEREDRSTREKKQTNPTRLSKSVARVVEKTRERERGRERMNE